LNVYPAGHSVDATTLHLSIDGSKEPAAQTGEDWQMTRDEFQVYPSAQTGEGGSSHLSVPVFSVPPEAQEADIWHVVPDRLIPWGHTHVFTVVHRLAEVL